MRSLYFVAIVFLLSLLTGSCAYSTYMVPSKVNDPVIYKGFKNFHLNSFVRHAVIYDGSGQAGDIFRCYVSDSLRFNNDTLYTLLGPENYKANIDSFVYAGEQTIIINKQVWQSIPLSKLRRIKSKRQPLSRTTTILSVVSYGAFLTGLIMAGKSDEGTVANKWGLLAMAGDFSFIAFYSTNTLVAKKRFIFRDYRLGQRHRPLVLM